MLTCLQSAKNYGPNWLKSVKCAETLWIGTKLCKGKIEKQFYEACSVCLKVTRKSTAVCLVFLLI